MVGWQLSRRNTRDVKNLGYIMSVDLRVIHTSQIRDEYRLNILISIRNITGKTRLGGIFDNILGRVDFAQNPIIVRVGRENTSLFI
ncbi:hypothetical protein ES703_117843 [subsurface metagenome]